MRDRRIAGDNQIQILHDRRGIDESIWPSIEILSENTQSGQGISIRANVHFLDADEAHAIHLSELCKAAKRNGTGRIGLHIWIAAPANANLDGRRTKPFQPILHQWSLRAEIGQLRGNGFEPRLKRAGKTRQCDLIVEALERFDTINDPDRAIEPVEEAVQPLAAEEADTSPKFGKNEQIAGELDRVAVALLVEHDDGPAVQIFAFPFRHRMRERLLRCPGKNPAVFVEFETLLEISAQQQKGCFVVIGVWRGGIARQGGVERFESLIEPAQIFERDGTPAERLDLIKPQRQRPLKSCKGGFRLLKS